MSSVAQFSKEEKEFIRRVHLLTGYPESQIKKFFEAFLVVFTVDYLDGESTCLPLFGDIQIKYHGDENTPQGRKAKIDLDFQPSNFLVRSIGQIEDEEESDLEAHLKEKLIGLLRQRME